MSGELEDTDVAMEEDEDVQQAQEEAAAALKDAVANFSLPLGGVGVLSSDKNKEEGAHGSEPDGPGEAMEVNGESSSGDQAKSNSEATGSATATAAVQVPSQDTVHAPLAEATVDDAGDHDDGIVKVEDPEEEPVVSHVDRGNDTALEAAGGGTPAGATTNTPATTPATVPRVVASPASSHPRRHKISAAKSVLVASPSIAAVERRRIITTMPEPKQEIAKKVTKKAAKDSTAAIISKALKEADKTKIAPSSGTVKVPVHQDSSSKPAAPTRAAAAVAKPKKPVQDGKVTAKSVAKSKAPAPSTKAAPAPSTKVAPAPSTKTKASSASKSNAPPAALRSTSKELTSNKSKSTAAASTSATTNVSTPSQTRSGNKRHAADAASEPPAKKSKRTTEPISPAAKSKTMPLSPPASATTTRSTSSSNKKNPSESATKTKAPKAAKTKAKTASRTKGRKSSGSGRGKLPAAKEIESCAPSETIEGGWPKGWIRKTFVRQSGLTKGSTDRYWYTPKQKYKLRSMTEVHRFMAHLKTCRGDEAAAWAKLKH